MSLAHIVRQTALILGLVFTVVAAGQASLPPTVGAGFKPAPTTGSITAAQAISTAIAPLSAVPGTAQAGDTPPKTQDTVPMQYRSGGHVLGFTSEGVLIAGRDHLLKVSFIGAASVAPEAADDSREGGGRAASGTATENTTTEPSASESKGAAALAEVHYRNLWPGISLRYDGKDGVVRSTYTLGVGAKVEAIRLAYNVATELTDQGSVTLTFATGTLHESAPIAWQEIDGERHPVTVAFHKHDNGEFSFDLGDYDPAHPVIIDPTLTWNTFLGGAGGDEGRGIATDGSGNVYVTGYSTATWGTPVQAHAGGDDAFVAKLNAVTGVLTWNTFLGGAGDDGGQGIATDGSGNVYVTGYSYATWGVPVQAYTGGRDAFVAKLNATTGAFAWNTFLGGAGTDEGQGIATDASGNVYVTGWSTATWGGPVRAYTGGNDAFTAKLNGATGVLAWHTFLGGAGSDYGNGIATDASGNVYVTGYSTATWGVPVQAYTGGDDAFAAKLNATTGVLAWSTFLGGAGNDYGTGIATDGSGNVYVTGTSGATWGAPARAYTGGWDTFVAQFNATTGVLAWNTFLGGAGSDQGYGIATDGSGNVYVTGRSDATWGAPMRVYTGGADAFVAKIADDIAVPASPNSFPCTPAPITPVLGSTPASAQPLFVSNPGVTDVLVGLALNGFAGAVDIYVAVVLPSSQILIHDTAPSVNWLPYPPAVSLRPASAAAVTMTSVPTNNLYYNPVSSGVPPGLYTSYVVVAPAGTNPATFNFASSPHYTWCNTRTFP